MNKKVLFSILVICLALTLTSCHSLKVGASDSGVVTALVPREYEVLGPVTMEGKITNIMGVYTYGGKGYSDLLAQAKAQYPETDAVIDIYLDESAEYIFGVYNTFTQNYMGTAIKYK